MIRRPGEFGVLQWIGAAEPMFELPVNAHHYH